MQMSWPSDDDLYAAFCRKDMAFDGVAYIAVRTTGIFCRPGCPARIPLRRNVTFFRTPDEAMAAGYRPCKRCRPLEPPESASALVRLLLGEIEAAPTRRWSAADLEALGVDPVTARRHFKKRFGVSFLEYSRAHRLAGAFAAIEDGASTLSAQLDAGFESSSAFREAFSRSFGQPPARARSSALLRSAWIDTPLGTMIALTDSSRLHVLEFSNRKDIALQLARYRNRLNAAFVPGETAPSRWLRRELDLFFSGRQLAFRIEPAETGTPFQEQVWARLRRIPPGSTLSYARLAEEIGSPMSVRAVANANAMNRCAIVTPCHRVVGTDGSLTGYAGGLPRKRWLIDHEARHSSQARLSHRSAS
jgi:AraC family transcriptional regulator, regulatory protein of adaptative response / methylated-DNA-[protein]-cysteine methyltransferase